MSFKKGCPTRGGTRSSLRSAGAPCDVIRMKMKTKNDQMNQPTKCPECGHHSFMKLEPEKGGGFTLLTVFAFIVDMFTPGMTKSATLEAMNQRRPGWMCEKCGWQVRVRDKS